MSAEDNKKLVRQFTDDVWNGHNPDRVTDYFADNFSETTPTRQLDGAEGYGQFADLFQSAFPDIQVDLKEIAADDDAVGYYYTVEGTNTENLGPLEATGQRVRLDGCVIRRIENGKFVEGWHQFDMLNMLVQMGVVETPEFFTQMQQALPGTGEQMASTAAGSPGGADKQIIRNFIDDVWNNQNLDNLDQYVSDDYIEHNPMGDFYGIDTFRRGFIEMTLGGYPDFQVEVGPLVGDDKFAACAYSSGGTHSGNFGPLEPTNNTVEIDGCYVCRIEDGKIVEGYNQFDQLSMAIQLELIEPPEFLVDIKQRGIGATTEGRRPSGQEQPGV